MLPLQAFFCSLCCEFSKDIGKAEEHIKSVEHNKKFKVSLSLSPQNSLGSICRWRLVTRYDVVTQILLSIKQDFGAKINLFIQAISIVHLQVHHYSEALPATARTLCQSFTPKRHRQLRVKDLLEISTWRLERNSNPRPFG